jgi:hypothetical protein
MAETNDLTWENHRLAEQSQAAKGQFGEMLQQIGEAIPIDFFEFFESDRGCSPIRHSGRSLVYQG